MIIRLWLQLDYFMLVQDIFAYAVFCTYVEILSLTQFWRRDDSIWSRTDGDCIQKRPRDKTCGGERDCVFWGTTYLHQIESEHLYFFLFFWSNLVATRFSFALVISATYPPMSSQIWQKWSCLKSLTREVKNRCLPVQLRGTLSPYLALRGSSNWDPERFHQSIPPDKSHGIHLSEHMPKFNNNLTVICSSLDLSIYVHTCSQVFSRGTRCLSRCRCCWSSGCSTSGGGWGCGTGGRSRCGGRSWSAWLAFIFCRRSTEEDHFIRTAPIWP